MAWIRSESESDAVGFGALLANNVDESCTQYLYLYLVVSYTLDTVQPILEQRSIGIDSWREKKATAAATTTRRIFMAWIILCCYSHCNLRILFMNRSEFIVAREWDRLYWTDKWCNSIYTKAKSTKPTNKLILSMTINQYIVSQYTLQAHAYGHAHTQCCGLPAVRQ